jgi:mono/diheme cytochrome c family protein
VTAATARASSALAGASVFSMNLLHSSAGLACAALSLLACGGAPAQPVGSAPAAAPLVGDAFFVARGASLGLSPEAARARDAGISESTPPEAAPDAMLAANAAAVWTSLCAQCHGGDGAPRGGAADAARSAAPA